MKTPDEIKKALKCHRDGRACHDCPYEQGRTFSVDGVTFGCSKDIVADALAYIKQLEAERDEKSGDGRWSPCDEDPPENGEAVLCWYEYYRYGSYNRMVETYGIGFQFNGFWGGEVAQGKNARPLFWMPLPKPPQKKKGGLHSKRRRRKSDENA